MTDIYDSLMDSDNKAPTPEQAIPQVDIYDQLMDADIDAGQQRTGLVLDVVSGINPDNAAKAKKLSQTFGLAPESVEKDLPEFERRARIRENQAILAASPILARQISDPEFAKLAQDDTANLSGIETLLRSFKRGLTSGLQGNDASNIDESAQILSLIDQVESGGSVDQNNPYASLFSGAGSNPEALQKLRQAQQSRLSENAVEFTQRSEQLKGLVPTGSLAQFYSANGWREAFSSLASSPFSIATNIVLESTGLLTPSLPFIIGGGVAGGARGLAALTGTTSANAEYGTAIAEGIQFAGIDVNDPAAVQEFVATPEFAELRNQALIKAGVVGAFDAATAGLAGVRIRPSAVGNVAAQGGIQAAGGAAGEAVGSVASGQDISASSVLAEAIGELPTAVMDVAVTSGKQLRLRQAQAIQAEQGAQLIEGLNDLAASSKVLARDTETFEQFIAQAAEDGPVQQIFIDANTLMQSGIADQVAAISPAVAAQLDEAVQTGGQIAIPVEEYTARIAPSEFSALLLDDLKTQPEGFSRAEAQEFLQNGLPALQEEMQAAINEESNTDIFRASTETVKADLKAQLDSAARFTPQVNDAYASMVSNWYAVEAARMGITPEEMYSQYKLNIVAENVAGPQFEQSQDAPAFREWFGDSKVVDADGKPLVVYHETDADFSEFRIEDGIRSAGDGEMPTGAFFKPTPRSIGVSNSGQVQMPVYLALRNPLTIANREALTRLYSQEIEGYGALVEKEKEINTKWKDDPRTDWATETEESQQEFDEAIAQWEAEIRAVATEQKDMVNQWFSSQPYDGLIVENDAGSMGRSTKTYIAFKPNQIKSATGNRGTFDPNDPNILHQSPISPTQQAMQKWKAALGRVQANNLDYAPRMDTPAVLQEMGIGSSKLDIPTRYLLAIREKHPDVPLSVFENLPTLLADPVFVLPHREGGLTVILDEKTDSGSSIAVGVRDGRIRTITPIDNAPTQTAEQRVANWIAAGLSQKGKIYARNKETLDKARVSNGASPALIAMQRDPRNARNIITRDNLVKKLGNEFYQGPRGAFSPATNTIALLKNADLSTFLHESGHFFLEAKFDIAAQLQGKQAAGETLTTGEQSALDDAETLLKWFDVSNIATWNSMSIEEQRPSHEKFARGFEAYLYEGRAPNLELQGIFQRFRAWMINVYKNVAALDVQLTPEVRSVFDRMMATNEQIALAEQGRSMMPLFANQEESGMSPEEYSNYQLLGVDATNQAIQELQAKSIRDMSWTNALKDRTIKRLNRQAASVRKGIRKEVQEELEAMPIFRAMRWLKYGEMVGQDGESVKVPGGNKLSIPALRDMYPENDLVPLEWKSLGYGSYGMLANDGLHPDIVADLFGFTSGDQLVRELLETPAFNEAVNTETNARMLQQHGELSDPESIARAADAAIHNEVRARYLTTEANTLAKASGSRKVLASAARQLAQDMIARLKIRNIKPGQYTNAETRAARNAERALRSGDVATAATEKRNQLIQNYAAKAAYNAQEEVDKGLRYLNNFNGNIKSLDADYADQIDALLERFDLRRGQSNRSVDRRVSLAEWINSQREAGIEPDIPQELINEAFRTSYKNMTLEEFRGLVDSVKQIEHLGRLKHKLLTAADNRAYEAVRDEIAAGISANATGKKADTRSATTNAGRIIQSLKRFWAAHIKAATWAYVMDGGRDGGPVWEYFIRSANERGDMETTMRAEATERLTEIMAPVLKAGSMRRKAHYTTIDRGLTKESVFAIALNMGNEGNTQRLLGGEGWTIDQVAPILQSLTESDWKAVQSIWDYIESYRPQIAAKERRIYGKEPDWVEPRPFNITTADGKTIHIKGGYYPIKYDPMASQRAEENADAETAKRQLQGAFTTATTRRSFTKSRVDEVQGRPLLYTIDGVYSGVNDVIHDLAWHEWLIDANRLLRSHSIDTAMRNSYGPEAKQQFKTWVQDIAEGERGAANAVEAAASRLRQGVSVSGLGFNIVSAAMQVLGLTQSIVRIGPAWMGRGIAKYIANPVVLSRQVNDMSDFMANRSRTRFRELNELRNRVQGQTIFNEYVGRYAYFLMMRFQMAVDVPTWWGAYEKAIADGNVETRAIQLADQAVIDSQGGGQTKDLAAIERGGPMARLFTVFYSFMNTAFNLGIAKTMTANTPAKRARLAADYLLLYVIPSALGFAMKEALTPGGDDDWDMEKIARSLAAEQISYLMGMMVIAREFSEVSKIITGAEGARNYQGPAGLRVISDSLKLAQQASQGEFDDAFRKALVNVVGSLAGLPAAQVNRSITGAIALQEGETDSTRALLFGYRQ
ncbi:hypothetical protein SAMN05192560_0785 [Methylobacillus rhizosphaerae]|uniref:Uncharacterized protein n=1 Tax=Methylobacillus rhizosphaerae TaxID=551994 RepID=A0A238YRR4_9PROT|nr:hypothetical protein [Methylobacillus rhizosphaerae]SNR73835.1 hypothetical protein SAMN05192560_0785 [Methylobacillus rhizosphaerae]